MKISWKGNMWLAAAVMVAIALAAGGGPTAAIADDLPAILPIDPVPRGLSMSPVIGADGLYIEPRSGPLESIDETVVVIGDVTFRMAPSIRFLRNREGFDYSRGFFTPGTFVEYLLNDDREVTAIWPASGS